MQVIKVAFLLKNKMNTYQRPVVSNVLLSERLIAELRCVQTSINDFEKNILTEMHSLKSMVSKQNRNASTLQNLRSLIGHSRSAVITFVKNDTKVLQTTGLYVKNTHDTKKLRRSPSDSAQPYTFDFIRCDNSKVTPIPLLIHRLETAFTNEILQIRKDLNEIQRESKCIFLCGI